MAKVSVDRDSNLRDGHTGTINAAANKTAKAEPAKNTHRWRRDHQIDNHFPPPSRCASARRATSSCNRLRVAGGMGSESPAAERRRLA